MTKILYSPGFGAGWYTWNPSKHPDFAKFILTYQPIIEAIERGEEMSENHPAVLQCAEEARDKYGEILYLGGAYKLEVAEVDGPFKISEYDGSESVETPEGTDWITL